MQCSCPSFDTYGKIFWGGKTFPDATMTKKQVKRLKAVSKAEDTDIDCMVEAE